MLSLSDAIGQQTDGEREEIRLVPAQDGAEIPRRREGRTGGTGWPHDASARRRRLSACRHFPAPRFAGPPAGGAQVVADGGEHVGLVGPDVGAPVAVAVRGISEEAARDELALAHRAGPRAL